jgi:TolA-binding protein
MRTVTLSLVLVASAAFAGLASAQEAAPPAAAPAYTDTPAYTANNQPEWDGDAWRQFPGPAIVSRMEAGVAALKAMDYMTAEEVFAHVLRVKPANADANFYMGVAKMNLGEWEDAKTHLEIAVRKKPKHPDPKSRLGVAYAKLGNTTGAIAQRAELVKMSETCKRSCKDFTPFISGGIEMIDEALGKPEVQGRG